MVAGLDISSIARMSTEVVIHVFVCFVLFCVRQQQQQLQGILVNK